MTRKIQRDSDSELLVELAVSPLIARLVHAGIEADERFLAVLSDMIVAGARAGAAVAH